MDQIHYEQGPGLLVFTVFINNAAFLPTFYYVKTIIQMHFFYAHVPWKIDGEDYNCSFRSESEWRKLGSVNSVQGWYFAVMGTGFSILYTMCLYGMYRASLLKIPCYRLMFFNGILDIVDLFLISSAMAYFHFTGAVFCSSPVLEWIAGHFAYSFWLGTSFNCIVLAFNRFVEMIPSVAFLRFLFRGKVLYIWVVLSVAYMLMAWFALRPIPFNSAVSAFIATPMIRDFEWEYLHFTSAYQLIHNGSLIIVMTLTYTILCYHIFVSRTSIGRTENYRIFMQVFLICLSTGCTAIGYLLLEFLIVPRSVIIAAHVFWQLSHGVHAVIYLCFNKRIRKQVLGTFVKSSHVEQSTGTAITYNISKSDATTVK